MQQGSSRTFLESLYKHLCVQKSSNAHRPRPLPLDRNDSYSHSHPLTDIYLRLLFYSTRSKQWAPCYLLCAQLQRRCIVPHHGIVKAKDTRARNSALAAVTERHCHQQPPRTICELQPRCFFALPLSHGDNMTAWVLNFWLPLQGHRRLFGKVIEVVRHEWPTLRNKEKPLWQKQTGAHKTHGRKNDPISSANST